MAAVDSSTNPIYHSYWWGDCIRGTKAQLQAVGLGIGSAFPGEPGGPARTLRVSDRRGFVAEISHDYLRPREPGRYEARIAFPDRARPPTVWRPYALGVEKCDAWASGDYYRGTADAIVAAGLVPLKLFPGQPGRRKMSETFLADPDTLPRPLKTRITRTSKSTFTIFREVSDAESDRRTEVNLAADSAWRRRAEALPRPPKLKPLDGSVMIFEETAGAPTNKGRKSSLKGVDEYRERAEDLIVNFACGALKKIYGSIETAEGFRYTMNAKALADVISAIDVAAQRIRDVPVKVEKLVSEEEKANARERATSASMDAAFQRFLAQIPKSDPES